MHEARAGLTKLLDFDDVRRRAVTISCMPNQPRYTQEHAEAGLDAKFPEIETWANQFPGYEIVIDDPEFIRVSKTGLRIWHHHDPLHAEEVVPELKSLKAICRATAAWGFFRRTS
jgi:hypothetical protein